jgi:hypothetical protein
VIVDCDTCVARGPACGDCVITVLLGPPDWSHEGLAPAETAALAVLADSGLVPPLRLVPRADAETETDTAGTRRGRAAG